MAAERVRTTMPRVVDGVLTGAITFDVAMPKSIRRAIRKKLGRRGLATLEDVGELGMTLIADWVGKALEEEDDDG